MLLGREDCSGSVDRRSADRRWRSSHDSENRDGGSRLRHGPVLGKLRAGWDAADRRNPSVRSPAGRLQRGHDRRLEPWGKSPADRAVRVPDRPGGPQAKQCSRMDLQAHGLARRRAGGLPGPGPDRRGTFQSVPLCRWPASAIRRERRQHHLRGSPGAARASAGGRGRNSRQRCRLLQVCRQEGTGRGRRCPVCPDWLGGGPHNSTDDGRCLQAVRGVG